MTLRLVKTFPGFYTGIGSRKTPQAVLNYMREAAILLADEGWTLRSGGAPGADTAFEEGANVARGDTNIFIPWDGFEDRHDESGAGRHWVYALREGGAVLDEATRVCRELFLEKHWKNLRPGGKKCHIRNVLQVLGIDLQTPSRVIVCWTPEGRIEGGTRTAILLAGVWRIPVINLGGSPHRRILAFGPQGLVEAMREFRR